MIGQKLGNYRILEQIGTGRMTTVYRAHDPDTNHYVAVKVLPPSYFRDLIIRTYFQRGAEATAHLKHPHILPIFAYGEEGDAAYIAMLFLPSGTLKDRIQIGRLSLLEAAAILAQVASALDYAHTCGILHGDVKPSNILLDEASNVYLSDFAAAKMMESTVEAAESGSMGTPAYMSPEQCRGDKNSGPASDQYSLGVVAYEMLTGRLPFQAETPLALIQMHLSAPVPPPRSLCPDLPESAQKAILKALEKDPGNRWPTCSHISGALSHAFF